MNFLKTLLGWGRDAWNFLTGLPGDVSTALSKVWHYVTSAYHLFGWLIRLPVVDAFQAIVNFGTNLPVALHKIHDALERVEWWVWSVLIRPWVADLMHRIGQLRAWTQQQLIYLAQMMLLLYRLSLAYTRQQVGTERRQRIAAVRAEHAAMIARVNWALQVVQQEAASGYNTGLHHRLGMIRGVLDDLATRNPVVRGLISRVITLVLDLAAVENPAARLLASFLLNRVLSHLGVDRAAGDLAARLLGPAAGQPRPKTLHDVIRELDLRLTAQEEQWAAFMADGGPEVEQAGREWKTITNVAADAGLLGFFGLALADPQAWARGVAGTAGAAGNDVLTGIIDAIRKA